MPQNLYPKYFDRQAEANSVDPDQMPQNVASDLGLHCLPFIQQLLDTSAVSKMDLFKLKFSMVRYWNTEGSYSNISIFFVSLTYNLVN